MAARRTAAIETGLELRPVPAPPRLPSEVRVSDILDLPGFAGSRVLGGRSGLSTRIDQVNVIQIPTDRFVKRDELVLTAAGTFRGYRGDLPALVDALRAKGISALAIRGPQVDRLLGPAVLRIADKHHLPIIQLPTTSHLSELQTQVLETIVRARTHQLKQAESIRDQLADHVLRGGGLEAVPQAIADVIHGDVVLVDRDGEVLAASAEADTSAAARVARACLQGRRTRPGRTDDGWIAWPVVAGGRRIGCLVARVTGDYDPSHYAALQHGATDAALQILHRDEAIETDSRLKAGFVRDLLTGSGSPVSGLRRAEAIGWNPHGFFRALLVGANGGEPTTLVRNLRHLAPDALITERGEACLVILPVEEAYRRRSGRADRAADDGSGRLAERVTRTSPGVHVGISARHVGLEQLPAAVSEAREALRTSRIFDRPGRIRRYEQLGVLQFLAEVPAEELRAFERSVLRPLNDLDTANQRSLLATLLLLIEADLNVAETARRGGWHYNTVRNRVNRLEDLFGPLTDSGVVLDALRLALVIHRDLGDQLAEGSL